MYRTLIGATWKGLKQKQFMFFCLFETKMSTRQASKNTNFQFDGCLSCNQKNLASNMGARPPLAIIGFLPWCLRMLKLLLYFYLTFWLRRPFGF
jgi:hypothetical protein